MKFFVNYFFGLDDTKIVQHFIVILIVFEVSFENKTGLCLLAHIEQQISIIYSAPSKAGANFYRLITNSIPAGSSIRHWRGHRLFQNTLPNCKTL